MAFLARCDPTFKTSVHDQLQKIVSIICSYQWIIDAYVSDFYTKGFWNQLLTSQQAYFDVIGPSELSWLLDRCDGEIDQLQTYNKKISVIPPLSLLALRCCISSLALQRTAVDIELASFRKSLLAVLGSKDNVNNSCCSDTEKQESKDAREKCLCSAASTAPNFKNGQCMDMRHVFRKHVKPKKQHEINNLGQVVSILSQAAESSSVVDVGAGLGHLARVLAFQHNLQVTTIEATGGHAPKASEYDKDLKKNINKVTLKKKKQMLQNQARPHSQVFGDIHEKGTEGLGEVSSRYQKGCIEPFETPGIVHGFAEQTRHFEEKSENPTVCDTEMPRHVICTVQPDIAADQFLDIMLNRSDSCSEYSKELKRVDPNFVLAGLHACGDLTPTLLRVFLNCPTARGLASVSCCYMKMTASKSSPQDELDNFPMSSFLQDLPMQCLSYEAREMACHFADSYHQRLLENPSHLKSHSYRAALEKLLKSVCPSFKSGQARITSKIGPDRTFYQYAADNLKKLGIDIESVPGDLMNECIELTGRWKRVVAFYTLRLSLAPLVETLLLYDRALFLLENGVSSLLVPIFDPKISPRNFALLAVKP
ncbi:ribosomal RNA adenine dimethylase domain containing 1 [Elysia marginata]|uniref:Ribosomal RNA adenine dimethylase domain containing 1 n=1 Tax=Elysia marginata TaxID=1093978 RepID=A0AAV4H6M6_9GAST|nr:ribosomal RNA adenine dimethylase domain containing 1 [Elysia marginata]